MFNVISLTLVVALRRGCDELGERGSLSGAIQARNLFSNDINLGCLQNNINLGLYKNTFYNLYQKWNHALIDIMSLKYINVRSQFSPQ